MIFRMA